MAPQRQRVLIIEDDQATREFISRTLETRGFQVQAASSAPDGLARLDEEEPELILLDLLLPGVDGFELCQRIRQRSVVPLIVLSPLDNEQDKVTALDLGVDDYLTVPFGVEELLARVRAVLRRTSWRAQPPQYGLVRVGSLEINVQTHQVLRDGQDIRLSRTEWALLELLVQHAGKVLTHRMLLQHVWGDTYSEESANLRFYIGRLRSKLEDDPASPRYLLTEPRVGYRLVTGQRREQPQAPGREEPPGRPPAGDESAAPPWAAGRAPREPGPTNLPTQLTSFIGRDAELSSIRALLERDDVRLLTLTGPGGTGKTRLALQAGAAMRAQFHDGVFFVALAPISDPDLVVSTIAQTLQIKESGGQPLLDELKRYLGDRRMLLLLDNFEQVIAAATLVWELMVAAPWLKVLVTSREGLRISGEHKFEVPPLSLPDLQKLPPLNILEQSPAVALFVERARAAKYDFTLTADNAPVVAEICARLDGLPLAIELAAAHITLLSPKTMLARLANRLALLTSGARNLPARQRTLRDTLDWSYDLLEAPDKRLFARLAVFMGGCTLEAAERVCNAAGDLETDVMAGLEALVNKSLLRQEAVDHGEPRLTLLETIHEYALKRLAETGESAELRRSHMHYYLQLAETAEPELTGPQQRVWLDLLEREHDNLRAALRWAIEQREDEIALRFTGALWRFWYLYGHISEGRRWFDAVQAHSPGVSTSVRAWAINGAGVLASMQGDYERAIAYFETSLALRQELGDHAGIANTLNNLANVALFQGNYERAAQLLEESLTIKRELGDTYAIATSLNNLGDVVLHMGDYARAAALCEESLALHRALGDDRDTANNLNSLGDIARAQRNFAQAEARYKESLALYHAVGDKSGIAETLEGLAAIAMERLGHERVTTLLGAAAALREMIGASLPPARHPEHERAIETLRAALDREAFDTAWATGQGMSVDQIIAFGLEQATH